MKKIELTYTLRLLAMLTVAFGLIFLAGCGDDDDGKEAASDTMLELLESEPGLDSLRKFIAIADGLGAGLSDFLGSETTNGTFFAPNNAAFQNLIASISGGGDPIPLESVNPNIMLAVLTYHVSSMKYEGDDLTDGTSIGTLQGEPIIVDEEGGEPTLFTGSTNPNITIANEIGATNGVMHVTNTVLIPPSVGAQLIPLLGKNGGSVMLAADFSYLAGAIQKADTFAAINQRPPILSILTGDADNTVFAPANPVFEIAAGGAENVPAFINSFTNEQWYGIILNHIVMGDVAGASIMTGVTMSSFLPLDASGTVFNQILPLVDAAGVIDPPGVAGTVFLDGNGDVDLTDQSTYPNLDGYVALPDASVTENGRVHALAGILLPPMPPSAEPIVLQDFESDVALTAFGGSTAMIIDNPDQSGINESSKVAETVHGNETWAGFYFDMDAPLDLSAHSMIKIKVWAPMGDWNFRLKLENIADAGQFHEYDVAIPSSGEWVELTFDLTSDITGAPAETDTYARIVMFPGWDVADAGTFYVDDVSLH